MNEWKFLFPCDQNWLKATLALHTRITNGKTKTKCWAVTESVKATVRLESSGAQSGCQVDDDNFCNCLTFEMKETIVLCIQS